MPVKVAIDTSPIKNGHAVRGVGFYTQKLLEELQNLSGNEEFKDIQIGALGDSGNINDFDILHYPFFDLFFLTLPLIKKNKTVVTVHDVTPLVFPEHYPPGIRGKIKNLIQKFSLRRVDAVITDSMCSKKDIAKYLKFAEEKIYVIPLAPAHDLNRLKGDQWQEEVKKRYNLPDKFVLYVGDVNWNKNVLTLVKACKEIGMPLVIVGKQAAQKDFDDKNVENQPLKQLIQMYGQDPDVLRLGFIYDEDLEKIYNLASVYCLPSFYEGFGLTVLEAMKCGCPVVAANTSSLKEIVDDAALLTSPLDYNEMAENLKKVIEQDSLRSKLIEAGLKNVKKYTWEKTAEGVIDVYRKIC